jgi:predicted transcriptional regulator
MSTIEGSKSIITQGQIRAGRALIGWSQIELSQKSGVSLNTIKRLEAGEGPIKARLQSVQKIIDAFIRHGLSFQNDVGRIGIVLVLDE